MSATTDIFAYFATALTPHRVFPVAAPEKAVLPRVIIRLSARDRVDSLTSKAEAAEATFELSCQGSTYIDAETLGDAAIAAAHAIAGEHGDTSVSDCYVLSESDSFVAFGDGSDGGAYERIVEIKILYL